LVAELGEGVTAPAVEMCSAEEEEWQFWVDRVWR